MGDQCPIDLIRYAEPESDVNDPNLRSLDSDPDYLNAAKLYVFLGTLERFALQEVMDVFQAEIHVIRLGDIAIASSPFELFLNYGNKIRARSLASQTFLIQLCNGWEGYLPTAKAEKGGHYSGFGPAVPSAMQTVSSLSVRRLKASANASANILKIIPGAYARKLHSDKNVSAEKLSADTFIHRCLSV